jgi:hypothetical protein
MSENGIYNMDELLDFINEETGKLGGFIYDECIDDSDKDTKMRMAVKKTIEHITTEIFLHFRDEISNVKEEYSQKLNKKFWTGTQRLSTKL